MQLPNSLKVKIKNIFKVYINFLKDISIISLNIQLNIWIINSGHTWSNKFMIIQFWRFFFLILNLLLFPIFFYVLIRIYLNFSGILLDSVTSNLNPLLSIMSLFLSKNLVIPFSVNLLLYLKLRINFLYWFLFLKLMILSVSSVIYLLSLKSNTTLFN